MGDPATSTDVSPLVVDGDTIATAAADHVDGPRRHNINDDDVDEAASLMSKSVSPRHYAPTALFLDKMSAHSEMQSSFADSGHFEDITCTSSVHSRDSYVQTLPMNGADAGSANTTSATPSTSAAAAATHLTAAAAAASAAAFERSELIRFYELKIEDLIKNHSDESQEVRVTHNDRVEALLRRLAECNARYADMVPDHEQAKERIRELERQLEELQQRLQEQENTQNKMYLHMFAKGQEAERMQQADKVSAIGRSCVEAFENNIQSSAAGDGTGVGVGGQRRRFRRGRLTRVRAGADAATAGDAERTGEHKGDYLVGLLGWFCGESGGRLLQLLRISAQRDVM